jgi:hypothetical protein
MVLEVPDVVIVDRNTETSNHLPEEAVDHDDVCRTWSLRFRQDKPAIVIYTSLIVTYPIDPIDPHS